MKKIWIILPLLLLTACKTIKEESTDIIDSMNKYNDGIYTTTADGYGGPFEISVTYKDDKIEDVTVGENHETPSIGGVAAEQIAKNVMEQNTIELDTISGATVTSNAMYDALKTIDNKAKKSTKDTTDTSNTDKESQNEN